MYYKWVRKNKIHATEISIVTPCYNEFLNVKNCADVVKKTMSRDLPGMSYEHIFVDNNSTDGTFNLLQEIARKDKRVKILRNSRNVGSFNNVWIGMQFCTGRYIVPSLAADLQDPPTIIPKMYSKLKANDVLMVYAVMSDREDKFLMKQIRNFYYVVINKLAEVEIPRNTGEFLLADKRVVLSVLQTNDCYPYIRGLFAQANVNSLPITYKRVNRKYGKSKENRFTLISHAINGFISTSRLLPRAILISGFTVAFLAVGMSFFNLFNFFIGGKDNTQSGIPTLLISVFFFSGIQLLFLGIATEYIQSIYRQVRPIPKSFITAKINF